MGTPEFRNFQPDTPLRRFGTSSKSNISATSGFFSPFRPQARTSSLTDRLFGTPDNKQALQPWKASHDADSVSQGEGLTRVPPFGLGGMVGSPGPSCEDMFGAGGSTKDADAYIPSNGRFDEDGHADDGWNKEEGVGSEASTLGSSQLKFEFPIDTQTTEDVFGLGDFQEVFVTEEDLDKAREKLSEEEAKTPEQSISEILHTLQRWCVQDEKAENGKDSSDEEPVTIFADVVICYNFIELSCGLVRLHESRLSWHGILPSASQLMKNAGPIVAGKPTTISWSRALLTDIRFKNLSDGKPLLMFTVEETHFLQLCFKEGREAKARQCTDLVQRMGDSAINSVPSSAPAASQTTNPEAVRLSLTPPSPAALSPEKGVHLLPIPAALPPQTPAPRRVWRDAVGIHRNGRSMLSQSEAGAEPVSVVQPSSASASPSHPSPKRRPASAQIPASIRESTQSHKEAYEARKRAIVQSRDEAIRLAHERCDALLAELEREMLNSSSRADVEEHAESRESSGLNDAETTDVVAADDKEALGAACTVPTEPNPSDEPLRECQLCFDAMESKVVNPCGHRLCASCAVQLVAMSAPKCPWDRTKFDNILDLCAVGI